MKISNWMVSPDKYLSEQQVSDLLSSSRIRAMKLGGNKVAMRDYFLVHLALATGLRVMEMATLNVGDLYLGDGLPFVYVRKGKGGRSRRVYIADNFHKRCLQYLSWKQQADESIGVNEPLLMSSHTEKNMTTRALQKSFKRCARQAGIPAHYSIHCLRHTYACLLLKAGNWNLRLVQKQLGHSRITTTQVYADVMISDIEKAINNMSCCFIDK